MALLAVLVLAAAAGCASTRPPPGPKVHSLEVKGSKEVKEGDIKAKILTTATPWYEPFWPFDEPRYFDANAWQADLRRIERFYEAEGYYQAQVLSSQVKPHGDKAVDLSVQVREGPVTRIASIEFRGFDKLPEDHRKRALADLPLVKGDVFKELDWEGVKTTIQARLRELGYAEAEVSGSTTVDVATQEAKVLVVADPGKRYRFGNTFVATDANPKVNHRRVIEQAQGAVKKGAWYSESALVEAQARVFRMGVFGAVKVNRGAPDREAGTVPIVVDVSEAPFHSIRAGGGVGVESVRQEVRLLTEYTDRNFFGGLRKLTLRARVGYAFLPSAISAVRGNADDSGPVANATAEFEQPRFLFRDVRGQASLTFERGLEPAYAFNTARLRTGVAWQPHRSLTIAPAYSIEIDHFSGDERATLGGTAPALAFGCADTLSASCTIALSYLEQLITWDRRDDVSEPRSGYYMALGLQEAGSVLQGDFTYLRVLPEARVYRTVDDARRLTLSARVRAGKMFPIGQNGGEPNSPIITRFFSGGDLMRGFNSRRLSPQLGQILPNKCITKFDENGNPVYRPPEECDPNKKDNLPSAELVPIGGEGLLETSFEARYRVTQSLVLAAFYETGLVTAPKVPLRDNAGVPLPTEPFGDRDTLQHAVGIGLRYLTLIGPIRLDIGYRPPFGGPLRVYSGATTPAEQQLVEDLNDTSCFGLFGNKGTKYPGAPEGRCSFHLSIGEAF
ncbi:BamA/TamA family outer membrane protein [Aggregicoccus sp. 17bor-14]|nr:MULTISPECIES: POTRA domain-containing protein [Myxococcaceae]MRI91905.1 BamA/TamA family outer membrane protein [Aggregicoccus sp. 17bor-14]